MSSCACARSAHVMRLGSLVPMCKANQAKKHKRDRLLHSIRSPNMLISHSGQSVARRGSIMWISGVLPLASPGCFVSSLCWLKAPSPRTCTHRPVMSTASGPQIPCRILDVHSHVSSSLIACAVKTRTCVTTGQCHSLSSKSKLTVTLTCARTSS